MRFLGYTLANEAETPTEPPSPDLHEKMGRFVEEATKAGVSVATGGIAPTSEGARISLKDGQYTVIDGPFAEAKELVGGWALMECRDLPEAVEWSKRFLGVLGEGAGGGAPRVGGGRGGAPCGRGGGGGGERGGAPPADSTAAIEAVYRVE